MVLYEHSDSDSNSNFIQWGLHLLDGDPIYRPGYYNDLMQYDVNVACYGPHYQSHHDTTSDTVENDEIIARALLEEFSQLEIAEPSRYLYSGDEDLYYSLPVDEWQNSPIPNYSTLGGHDYMHNEDEHAKYISSCSSPGDKEDYHFEPADDYALDAEVDNRFNQMVPIHHIPKINGEIPSYDVATSDHQRLLDRLQLYDFVECTVHGDGNCQFRALSDQLYRTPEHHDLIRRRVVEQLKLQQELYKGYVPMAYSEYLGRMSMSGEWGDHVTLQAAADSDTCCIEILPQYEKPKRVIFLNFWAEVHYNSIYPQGDISSSDVKKKQRWWTFGIKD